MVREDKGAPTPEQRAAASEIMQLNRKTKGVLSREAVLEAQHAVLRYRFSVGHNAMGMFFHVQGQGDSWEAAFQQAESRK